MPPPCSRRTFLRSAGVAVALPVLDSLAQARANQSKNTTTPRRLIAINHGLGLHAPNLIPESPGRDYQPPPYLAALQALRDDFTIISGTSHPDVDGGHSADRSFLTTAPHPGSANFTNSISIDQLAARQIGLQTRFAYLALSDYSNSISVAANGAPIPGAVSPARVFEQMFLEGRPEQKARRRQQLREGRSVLDTVLEQTRRMQSRVGRRDREKLDGYFTAVRETEQRLAKADQWEHKPKPHVDAEQPTDINDHARIVEMSQLKYDLMFLAVQTDSTRLITYAIGGPNEAPALPGVTMGYHNLSHHGKDPAKIEQLTIVELAQMKVFGELLRRMKETPEGESNLLDHTMVLLGSHMGNASSHDNRNLPIILAGGGFRHGQHLAFNRDHNEPLANLYVSMLQQLGLEVERFGSSTGTLRGLETRG